MISLSNYFQARMKFKKDRFSLFSFVVVSAATVFVAAGCSSENTGTTPLINDTDEGGGINAGEASVVQNDSGSDVFDTDGPLVDYTTNNASSLPAVVQKEGRYHATLLNNNNEITLHFNDKQGRLDAKKLSFPFEFIARNIGIGTLANSQIAPAPNDFATPSKLYMFAGIQVHVLDLDERNSAHMVVGHRGSTSFTVEGKNTVNGRSSVNDAGQGVVPNGRADLRLVGDKNKSLRWFWQQPNIDPTSQPDDWIAYRGNGKFPGKQASYDDQVYVGLITYAFTPTSVPFVGTADSIEWNEGTF